MSFWFLKSEGKTVTFLRCHRLRPEDEAPCLGAWAWLWLWCVAVVLWLCFRALGGVKEDAGPVTVTIRARQKQAWASSSPHHWHNCTKPQSRPPLLLLVHLRRAMPRRLSGWAWGRTKARSNAFKQRVGWAKMGRTHTHHPFPLPLPLLPNTQATTTTKP